MELEISKVETAIKKLQAQMEGVVKNIEDVQRKRENIRKSMEDLKKEIKRHKELIEDCKEGVKRAEERLNLVKKAEEYKALLREKAKHEDCIIKSTNRIKELEMELKKLEDSNEDKKLLKELQELEEEFNDMRYSQSRLLSRVEELKNKLQEFKENIHKDIVEEYETLKRKHGLPVILPVDSLGACTNCGTKLPSALYSQLIKGDVVVCPSCGRLIYYEGET